MKIVIQGLKLHIDSSIDEICKVSNSTSTQTRSTLYVLVLVSIISVIAFLNSNNISRNWNDARFRQNYIALTTHLEGMSQGAKHKYDSIANAATLLLRNKNLEASINTIHQNVEAVKVPVMGNSFDINDLGLVSGITMIVLLTITVFTLNRERTNLRIALKAITDRYKAGSDKELFTAQIAGIVAENPGHSEATVLQAINETRRQHHYNYLTMNEIFNSPPVDIEQEAKSTSFFARAQRYLLYFPFLVYLLLLVNDLKTLGSMIRLDEQLTKQLITGEIIFALLILWLSTKCTRIKSSIIRLYTDFRRNSYECR